MLLFFRFFGRMFVLSVVCVVCGCERVEPVTMPIRETIAPSNLFAQLPACLPANSVLPPTNPRRVFLWVNIDAASVPTYEAWALGFAEHPAAKIDLWRGRENSRERGFLDWRFADVPEMCSYFDDAEVIRDLGELTRISDAIALSTDMMTLTETSVIDNTPSAAAFSVIIYKIDYPLGERTAYLRTTRATENVFASQPEVLRMAVYENANAEQSPNRVIVVSFASVADRDAFEQSETVVETQRQLAERAAKVNVCRFSRLPRL